MFIRKTKVKSTRNGDGAYYSYRIVESERIGDKVKQRTVLNLGKHFDIDPCQWPLLIVRIEHILSGQKDFFEADFNSNQALEMAAQRYAAAILQKNSQPGNSDHFPKQQGCFETINIDEIDVVRPRSIGVENLTYHAIEQLNLFSHLQEIGFNSKETAAAIGNIVGRLVSPASERSTLSWLQNRSALGELIGHDFHTTSLTRLYQVTDKLFSNRDRIEQHLSQRENDLFNLERRIVLYDLTNTYFEGKAEKNAKAQFGRSKEKRSDCPLVTMGLVLDGDGFPLRSRIFDGNVSEPSTLQEMIGQLDNVLAQEKPIIIMDAGISTEENVAWLLSNGYRYLVVSRESHKQKPCAEHGATCVKNKSGKRVTVQKVESDDSKEVRVYCHSEDKEKKEKSIRSLFSKRFEESLNQLNEGLSKKGCTKKYDKVLERIGRLKQQYPRVSSEYDIDVEADTEKQYAVAVKWQQQSNKKEDLMGVYCLRTNILNWEASELWQTYVMLTEVEETFRSLKTDFGLRPVYHQKEIRVSAHLFISLLAYHVAHTIRFQLKRNGIHLSWQSLRDLMSTQHRVTVSLITEDQDVIHVRTTSRAEPDQKVVYDALGLPADNIGRRKVKIGKK